MPMKCRDLELRMIQLRDLDSVFEDGMHVVLGEICWGGTLGMRGLRSP